MESTNFYQHQVLIQQQLAAAAGYPFFNWNPSISTSEEEYYNNYCSYKGKEELWKRNTDTFSSTKTQIIQDSHEIKDMNGLKDNYFKEYDFDLNENFMSQDSYMNNAKTCCNNGFYGNNYMSSHREYSNFQDPNFSFNGLMYKNNSTGDSTSIIGMQEVTQSAPEKKRLAVSNNIGDSSTAKRLNYPAEALSQEPSKKPRVTSQSSSTLMLKVRKEKLGDRISALHRLVAPFGKTDTASVLTEAIGYIQFLQDQIQKLSIPYTKSSQGTLHQINLMDSSVDVKGQAVVDLKNRGLCLVPISLSSYITTTSCDGNNI